MKNKDTVLLKNKILNSLAMKDFHKCSSKRILIIDDYKPFAKFLFYSIKEKFPNLSLDIAHTALKGIEKAVLNKPDLAIIDFHLPDMTGDKLAKILNEIYSFETIFLFISGLKNLEKKITDVSDEKTHSFMQKPIDIDDFSKKLIHLMHLENY